MINRKSRLHIGCYIVSSVGKVLLNCSTDYILTGVNYSDSFIDEIVGLARTIKSEEIKKMIVLQVKAATEMEKSVKLIE